MNSIVEVMKLILSYVVVIGSLILEMAGILILLVSAWQGFMRWTRHEEDGPQLEEGISMALEFLMCGEVLKTATASGVNDYIALGAIIILRFALALEVHWEMKKKKESLEKKDS